ncbi:uncharacterized protein LOC116851021 isoform X2 [Odontomachus brunneus]|uniref:uncharacterized protein LOC116851021 isoform X2 n=1 Tax=Odontomachus brunneus TaxID=486640 RepID=UPI0013F1DB4E|nr:uncharacterized protein LOC116851021 isoform X2 [Odontomachus brunneus]
MLTLIKTMFESMIKKMELAVIGITILHEHLFTDIVTTSRCFQVALPSLLLDPELPMILTPDEMNVINDIFLCDKEVCKHLSSSDHSCIIINDFKSIYNWQSQTFHALASENRKSMTNSEIVDYISTSKLDRTIYKILKILEKHIDVLRMSPRYKCISVPSALFLHHIRYLLEQYVLCRMFLTPEQARNKELHYRKLWRCYKRSTEDIATFTCDLERQRANHGRMLEDVVKHYKKNIIAINKIHNKCNQDVANITTKYERKQLVLYKTWELEQKDVQLALENAIDDLKSLKQMNEKLEEDVHERRSAIESKLMAIINEYDMEIGSRYRMLEELAETYEYNKSERCTLENEIKQQEVTYVNFVKRREEAEKTRWYERLSAFRRERAAKFIQRWWRKIFRRRKETKIRRKRT